MNATTGLTTEPAASSPPRPQTNEADRDRVLAVDRQGGFPCAQAAALAADRRGRGRGPTVNVSSIDAFDPSSVGLARIPRGRRGAPKPVGRDGVFLAPERGRRYDRVDRPGRRGRAADLSTVCAAPG